MDRDSMIVALTAEILRSHLPAIEEDLKGRYTDGGKKSGARREAILEAITEAHALATEAATQLEK